MKRLLVCLALTAAAIASTGCLSPDPSRRNYQLLRIEDKLRQAEGDIERFWMLHDESHLWPDRED